MSKFTIKKILNNPIDYLYLFATDKFLSYLGGEAPSIIRSKRENQKKICHTIAVENGSTLTKLMPKISAAIVEQYGYTPEKILTKLALGENVAGKNWKEGVYGVGITEHTNFATGTDITVDAHTGKILQNGIELDDQTPVYKTYKNKTYIAGYSAIADGGTQYSSNVRGDTYKTDEILYNSATYSTNEKQYRYNGSLFTAADASSLWECINTYLPEIKALIEWLVNTFFGQAKLVTAANTVPSQREFMRKEKATDFEKIAIVGAALVGGYLLLSDKKN